MPPTQEQWNEWEQAAIQQLGKAVRAERERAGLSQRALADAAGIDRGQIANIEGGKDGKPRISELPRIGVLVRLAYALKAPPIMLLYPGMPDEMVHVAPNSMRPAKWAAMSWVGQSDDWVQPRSDAERLMKEVWNRPEKIAERMIRDELRNRQSGGAAREYKALIEAEQEIRSEVNERIRELGGTVTYE
ncbi:helix-turn-helix domain-containing protein [Rhodococcus rhodochrous]|uniref:helix-turn-helix domain-containing protein n=1 Tax=Rhodococcus rhodochrous TaxID=1829 RepID=UPI001E3B297D|nr:helix-turn-helix transcriptional regulator [Rhodococcus rhodochrous]MCB8910205.1 helix-turn-helix domain-containing protein [Rhodococcus rhodochrous]